YIKELKEILLIFERKKLQVQQTAAITEGLALSLDRKQLMERVSKLHTPIAITSGAPADIVKTKAAVGESKRITLDLFKEGKTIDEIAAQRSMAKSTIEGHLADFIPTGEIDILDLMPKAKLDTILKVLNAHPTATSSMHKEQLGAGYSYADIKAALAFHKKDKD
ncbi:MAG: helicase, partial [Sphingobacteriales bacterium]